MTHEYPHNPEFDSVSVSRVMALSDVVGFTQRQREFLVTVMVHAGCFLERQYCTFIGTARGKNSREFVARLVARGFARAIEPGPARRGRLYHVHHKPLYEAIGNPDDRNRRLHSIGRMVERVMILDAVLGDRRCWWLSPEADKRTFFDTTQETGLSPEEYPHITFRSGSREHHEGETRGAIRGRVGAIPTDAGLHAASQGIGAARLARQEGFAQERGSER